MVWRGGDPRPVPLIPAVAGLTVAGVLMDEDEDAEEDEEEEEEEEEDDVGDDDEPLDDDLDEEALDKIRL